MIAAIIQARMGSTRLPGKVLENLSGKPVLFHVVERVKKAKKIAKVVVATTTNPEDDKVAALCMQHNYDVFRGSSSDVLGRYYNAANEAGADAIVRITSDCPLIDPDTIDRCIEEFIVQKCDYISNVVPGKRTFPRGLDTEVFSFSALQRAHAEANDSVEREHVTPFIWKDHRGLFSIGPTVTATEKYNRPEYRLTLDYPEDLELLRKVYDTLYVPGTIIPTLAVLQYLDENPDVTAINSFREAEQVKV